MNLLLSYCLILLTYAGSIFAETSQRGYIRNSTLYQRPAAGKGKASLDNIFAARQNFRWYASPAVTLGAELKEQAIGGSQAQAWLEALNAYGGGGSLFKWRRIQSSGTDLVFTQEIDRLWLNFRRGPLELTVGRQRIAWGTNLVWNPIDIFNPSSPLDFDNEEKPGGDAVRVQYFTGDVTSVEVVFEALRNEPDAFAGAVKLNSHNYDFFLLTGSRDDLPLGGLGWAGSIRGAGFRGEILTLLPEERDTRHKRGLLLTAVSIDYTFASTLYLHSEAIYNSAGTRGRAGAASDGQSLKEGWLTPARWSLFGEAAYGLSPLLRAGMGGIINPGDGSWYMTPSAAWSWTTNLDLSTLAIFTGGRTGTEFGESGKTGVVRAKWSW